MGVGLHLQPRQHPNPGTHGTRNIPPTTRQTNQRRLHRNTKRQRQKTITTTTKQGGNTISDPKPPVDYKKLYREQIEQRLREEAQHIEQRHAQRIRDTILKETLYTDDQFNPVKYCDYLLNTYPDQFKTPSNDQGGDTIYRYDAQSGTWNPDGITYTEQVLEQILAEDTKTRNYTDVVKHLQVKTYIKPTDFQENPHKIVLKNGTLDTQTMQLEPHNPTNYARNRLPVTYNPEATCPKFIEFLDQVLPENIEFIQEWIGYHLIKDYRYQRCVVLLGDGDNGKSTLLNIITAFLGPENISTENLYRLTANRFSPAELYGKLANISADIGPDELRHTGTIKMLTGGDWITAERKNRDPFPYRNYAKLTFSCNQLPKTPDETLAFFKRFIVLTFNKPIPKEEQDPRLLEKLTTESELSGILNWALQGLQRCLERGALAEPGDAETRKELYLAMSDPVTGFINTHITEDPESFEVKQDLVNAFNLYCKQRGFIPVSDRKFYEQLRKTLYTRDYHPKLYSKEYPNGKQTATYRGIKLQGYKRSIYYQTKEEYQSKHGNQTRLDTGQNDDIDHPQTHPEKESDQPEDHDTQYNQYTQSELVKTAKKYLENNGGSVETTDLVQYLRDQGYTFEDYRRLKQLDIFTQEKTRVKLREDPT